MAVLSGLGAASYAAGGGGAVGNGKRLAMKRDILAALGIVLLVHLLVWGFVLWDGNLFGPVRSMRVYGNY